MGTGGEGVGTGGQGVGTGGGVRAGLALRFGLLGPTVLYHDAPDGTGNGVTPGTARAVGIRSPKSRALLTALLLDAGRVVSVESLKDALWGEAPPVSAQASLHNHVARVRRLLDDPERLRTTPSGYLLRVDDGELDVHVFDAQVAAARTAHTGRDWEGVLRACADAFALWRGAPLAGLPPEVGGYAFAQRLREARLLLLEWRHDAELALGGPRLHALVPELVALTGEHPLREAYHRQLMLALHRTGRQAEALAVHRDLRTRLVGQLGIEPGPGMRAAHVEVLREAGGSGYGSNAPGVRARGLGLGAPRAREQGSHTPGPRAQCSDAPGVREQAANEPGVRAQGLDVPGARERGSGAPGAKEYGTGEYGSTGYGAQLPPPPSAQVPPPPVQVPPPAQLPPSPAQLPPPPAHFTGRAAERQALHRVLTATGPRPTAVISGMPGAGKSALALRVAHDLAERFPQGQLHLDLRGATPGTTPLTPGQALTALLRDLGVEPCRIPESPDAASALLRSLLARTRTLLVLDGAVSAAQLRPLLPGGAGCAVIVTSRSPLTALDGAARFPLSPLSDDESTGLLRVASGRDDLDGSQAARLLVERTGRLPLALRAAAARLAARPALTPDALAAQLVFGEGRLRHLDYDDLSVRRTLAGAHDSLAASPHETDRDAALTLRRIGALDLPAYGAPLLARLTGTGVPRTEAALDRLVDVALLEEPAYGRYTPHVLVRDLARELAAGELEGETTGETEGETTRETTGETGGQAAGQAEGHAGAGRTTAPGPADIALRWYAAEAERAAAAVHDPVTGRGLGHLAPPAPESAPGRTHRCRPAARQPERHPARTGPTAPFASPEEAFAWADLELANIVVLVQRHVGDPRGDRAALVSTLVRLLLPYARSRGRTTEAEVLERAGNSGRPDGDADPPVTWRRRSTAPPPS
ncbi:AfsR/SARP family transcriptional regulator [Streptomyces sp. XY006]|uniref:AfsR/SARP family transcriptional regulator n=1 Tax=Streptomyces sp. XY006 TaxID=2021410 RepID=UPI00211AF5AE|nr:AfsR/SARP family transcriptional regulator [Streptomyces sp. XY006]